MVVQQPRMIDQGLQDQRLAAGDRAALAAHDRARRELGARHLIGLAVDGLAAARALGAAAKRTGSRLESPRSPRRERAAGRKAPARFAAEIARTAAIVAAAME